MKAPRQNERGERRSIRGRDRSSTPAFSPIDHDDDDESTSSTSTEEENEISREARPPEDASKLRRPLRPITSCASASSPLLTSITSSLSADEDRRTTGRSFPSRGTPGDDSSRPKRKRPTSPGSPWPRNLHLRRALLLLSGAATGALASIGAALFLAAMDEAHGGGHGGGGRSCGDVGWMGGGGRLVSMGGAASTLGRLVADSFPSCSLRERAPAERGIPTSSLASSWEDDVDVDDDSCWALRSAHRWVGDYLLSPSAGEGGGGEAEEESRREPGEASRRRRRGSGEIVEDPPQTEIGPAGDRRRRGLLRNGWFFQNYYFGGDDPQSQSSPPQQRDGRRVANSQEQQDPERLPTYLVVAGQMVVGDGECNIAQLDLDEGEWSLQQRIQLSLYNSYSGGEVYMLLANRTANRDDAPIVAPDVKNSSNSGGDDGYNGFRNVRMDDHDLLDTSSASEALDEVGSGSGSGSGSGNEGSGGGGGSGGSSLSEADSGGGTGRKRYQSGELIVVGAYDTTYRNSQVTYCSVGRWDGTMLNKMGEGLCNSALSKGMKITSAAFAGPHDVYVAGSFHTQVWNGDRREFVKIFNIAHFNALEQVWLPLSVGQLTCSWCVVTVLALAWDSRRRQLHVAGKFNAIENRNVPAGLAVYNVDSGHLVAHPGGGLTFTNETEDGVGTALQMDEESGVLYVMGSFERLSLTKERCMGLAAYEVDRSKWTCIADPKHTVEPTGGGNMLLTPYGLMVAGKVQGDTTTWPNPERPYTIALLTTTVKTVETSKKNGKTTNYDDDVVGGSSFSSQREYIWSWLPGFEGHEDPIHCLSNGYNEYEGTVFIGGDNFVAKWSYEDRPPSPASPPSTSSPGTSSSSSTTTSKEKSNIPDGDNLRMVLLGNGPSPVTSNKQNSNVKSTNPSSTKVPVTVKLANGQVRGSVMAIAQLVPPEPVSPAAPSSEGIYVEPTMIGYTILVYCIALGALFGMFLALLCNKNLNATIVGYLFSREGQMKGISLDTLTYSAVESTNVAEAYQRAMKTRFVNNPHLLTMINPAEIVVHKIIGEGTFGRVWSAKWRSATVAVKEFVFAQAAVAGKSSMQREIIDEIIGEAGMMAILRHPNVLQLYGCCLTSQAIWIVSELCSLGSLRQLLDDPERDLSLELKLQLALNVADGMTYLHTQEPPIIHRDLKSHNIFVHETSQPSQHDVEEASAQKKKKKSRHKKKGGGKSSKANADTSISNGNGLFGGSKKPSNSPLSTNVVAKIGDWGSARAALAGSRTMTHGVGTACWLAPEVIKHARSSEQSDVFGFGIILWELATREEVHKGLETTQIIAKVANENLRPPVPDRCVWRNLMVQCWDEDPQKRPNFETIGMELDRMLSWARNRADSDSSSYSYQESYQNSHI